MDMIFATNNAKKLAEAQQIIKTFKVVSLNEIGCNDEIPETHETIYENAEEKAMYLWNKYHQPCFSDDTGLEVTALNNAPGVYSARYAGPQRDSDDNMNLLLRNLEGVTDRRARFHTEMVLVMDGSPIHFEGYVNGVITLDRRGQGGFGYDPVFLPDGFDVTMAEMTSEQKNAISHRAMALNKMADFLLNYKR